MPYLSKGDDRPWLTKRKSFSAVKNTNKKFYNSREWKSLRASVIRENPWCEYAESRGRYEELSDVDHIIPINLGGSKTDKRNLMGLSKRVHMAKTGLEGKKKAPIVDSMMGYDGLIPVDRNDVLIVLKEHFDKR
jgi:5-methylcytosine-specific restriction endonuclease McrA